MKNVLVIGGSSGIGKALVGLLADSGNRVFATFRSNEPVNVKNAVSYHRLDVLDETLVMDFLPEKVDGVVYCPGSINLKPFNRIKPEAFVEDFNLQVVGAIKVIQAVMPRMKAAGHASIVLFSTVAVQQGFNFHSQVAASKGAIEGLARALAAELSPVIRVNCIAPSLTDTPLAAKLLSTPEKKSANGDRHPMKRVGEAGDIAEAAAYLLSNKSSWVTGQILHVDGGMSSIKN